MYLEGELIIICKGSSQKTKGFLVLTPTPSRCWLLLQGSVLLGLELQRAYFPFLSLGNMLHEIGGGFDTQWFPYLWAVCLPRLQSLPFVCFYFSLFLGCFLLWSFLQGFFMFKSGRYLMPPLTKWKNQQHWSQVSTFNLQCWNFESTDMLHNIKG